MTQSIHRVAVIGSGQMGSGIGVVCARAGCDVVVHEPSRDRLTAGRRRIEESLSRARASQKLSEDEHATALSRLSYTTDLDELTDREIILEAITEDENAKTELFTRLDPLARESGAIIGSNTSSIPIMKLAMATSAPERVLGIHFFNPVPVLPLVELVPTLLTSSEVTAQSEAFVTATLGKTAIHSRDRAGFVVNALLIPYLLSAVRMLESGFASADDIDKGMVLGCAHPMGPLHLADLIGLDTLQSVARSLYEELKEPLYAAPPILMRMVDAGMLGCKSKRGFFDYADA